MSILYFAIVVFVLCAAIAWVGNKIVPESKTSKISDASSVKDDEHSYMVERQSAGYIGLFED